MIRSYLFEAGRREILRGVLDGLDSNYLVYLYKFVNENDFTERPLLSVVACVDFTFYLGIQVNLQFELTEIRDMNAVVVFKDRCPLFGWYGDFSNEFTTKFVLTLLVEL